MNSKLLLSFLLTAQSTLALSAFAISPSTTNSDSILSHETINLRVTDISHSEKNIYAQRNQRGQDYDTDTKDYDSKSNKSNYRRSQQNESNRQSDYDR